MPQFDVIIIFPLINDLIFVLILHYLLTSNLVLKNITLNKFRVKILKLKNILKNINILNYILFFKNDIIMFKIITDFNY